MFDNNEYYIYVIEINSNNLLKKEKDLIKSVNL